MRSVTEGVLAFEADTQPFRTLVQGVPYWERIRTQVHQRLLVEVGMHQVAHDRFRPTARSLSSFAASSLRSAVFRKPESAPPAEYLFFGSPRRKLGANGRWWDVYCDPILEDFATRSVYFELPYRGGHQKPAQTRGIRYLDWQVLKRYIAQRLPKAQHVFTEEENKELQKHSEHLRRHIGVSIELADLARNAVIERGVMLPFYLRLLERTSPRAVILVCSYGHDTLIEACKQLSVPTIELQHGITGPYHPGYHYPNPDFQKLNFPDHILLYGEFWKQLATFPIPDSRVHTVGFPYLDQEVRSRRSTTKQRQIIFISQGTIGKSLSRIAAELAALSPLSYDIIYKLHPGEFGRWRTEYPWLRESGVDVVENDRTIYELFAESEIQVGVYSTAVYEGLAFGLRTILVDLPGIELMEGWASNAEIPIASNAADLLTHVRTNRGAAVPFEDFFLPDALHNVRETLRRITSVAPVLPVCDSASEVL